MKTEADAKTEKIVDSARRLFLVNGFEKTTMEEIARAIPMSKATLYAKFPNKEEILLAICGSHCEKLRKMLLATLDGANSNYLGCLIVMLKQYVTSVYVESSGVRTPEAMVYVSTRVKTIFHAKFSEMKKVFQSVLDKAIEAGELPEGTDSAVLCEVIVTTLASFLPPYERPLCAPQLERPDKETFDKDLDILLNLLFLGLRDLGRT